MNKLQVLYEQGILLSIESYYQIGWTFYLGDRFNGVSTYNSFATFDEGVEWIWNEALKTNQSLADWVKENM
jgi:hypothetical protein